MNESTIILTGSSRKDGNTAAVVQMMENTFGPIEMVDLNDLNIGYFDYDNAHAGDDFLPLMRKVVTFDQLVCVTPVYWYTMSAQLKTFFDRISDLLKFEKNVGRQLRGMKMGSISSSQSPDSPVGFEMPFRESAAYLGMDYQGHVHIPYVDDHRLSRMNTDALSKTFDLRSTAASIS